MKRFPEKWIGRLLIRSWSSLALFGILVFGVGNAAVAVRGFKRKTNRIFWLTAIMGGVLFLASAMPVILIGKWYLPTVQLLALSVLQLVLGLFGVVKERPRNLE